MNFFSTTALAMLFSINAFADLHYVETDSTSRKGMPGMPGMTASNSSKSRSFYIQNGKQASYSADGVLEQMTDYDAGKIIIVDSNKRQYLEASLEDYYRKMLSQVTTQADKAKREKPEAAPDMKMEFSYQNLKQKKEILGKPCALYQTTISVGMPINGSTSKMNTKSTECWRMQAPAAMREFLRRQNDWWAKAKISDEAKSVSARFRKNELVSTLMQSMDDFPEELKNAWKVFEEQKMEIPMDAILGGKGKGKKISNAEQDQMRKMMAAMMPTNITQVTKISEEKISSSKFAAPSGYTKISLEQHFSR